MKCKLCKYRVVGWIFFLYLGFEDDEQNFFICPIKANTDLGIIYLRLGFLMAQKVYSSVGGKEEDEKTPHLHQIDELGKELSGILDLEELEGHIYLNLLRTGPITASALAKELDIDRAKTYRTIDRLVSESMVSTTFSNPKLCIPIEPSEALKIVLRKKQDEINKIKKLGEKVIKKVKEVVTEGYGSNIPTFRIAQGSTNIYTNIEKLIEESSELVYIITTIKDISKMYHTNIPEKIKVCEKKGGEVRLIVEMEDKKMLPFIKRFGASNAKIGKLPSKGRIIVSKGSQMIMSDASVKGSLHASGETDFALCTNSYEMVNNIFSLCTFLWKSGKPIEL